MNRGRRINGWFVIGAAVFAVGLVCLAYVASVTYGAYQIVAVFGGRIGPVSATAWAYPLMPVILIITGIGLMIRSKRLSR